LLENTEIAEFILLPEIKKQTEIIINIYLSHLFAVTPLSILFSDLLNSIESIDIVNIYFLLDDLIAPN